MCSILGYCGASARKEDAAAALAKTISRGPDDSRLIDTGKGFLGFNRLSIVDEAHVFSRHFYEITIDGRAADTKITGNDAKSGRMTIFSFPLINKVVYLPFEFHTLISHTQAPFDLSVTVVTVIIILSRKRKSRG